MPTYFVVQPTNGFLAQFSTVVDDFTAINLTEAEAIQITVDKAVEQAQYAAKQSIKMAKNSPSRMEDCLNTIEIIHGREEALKRRREIEEEGW